VSSIDQNLLRGSVGLEREGHGEQRHAGRLRQRFRGPRSERQIRRRDASLCPWPAYRRGIGGGHDVSGRWRGRHLRRRSRRGPRHPRLLPRRGQARRRHHRHLDPRDVRGARHQPDHPRRRRRRPSAPLRGAARERRL
ncbi:MAG: hypothetical protein AVDCRST_MAG25-1492, partial [uncultured Rubrobacteraceae bacterium]